jgi:hypothetical protein
MGGGQDIRPRGKDSGVTAADVAGSQNHGQLAPGRTNLVQTTEVGNQWIDHGASCDGKDQNTQGCFLADAQRMRLIIEFKNRVQTAQTNYKLALTDLRVDKLMQKDDDLNWVLGLALDVVGAHFLSVALTALKNVRATGLRKLEALALEAGNRGQYESDAWAVRAENVLNMITPNSIQSYTTTGFGLAKTSGRKGVQKMMNKEQATLKAASLSYIDQLTDSCDLGFQQFADHAAGFSNDAELVVLLDGMEPANHAVSAYKAELGAKVARFEKSGVNDIGRQQQRESEFHETDILRDTRCIWVRDIDGQGKTLWYQAQEGNFDPAIIESQNPRSDQFRKEAVHQFGPEDPTGPARLKRIVPEEFREGALAKSEQTWGMTPTIQNPYVTMMRARGVDMPQPDEPENPQAVALGIPRLQLGKTQTQATPDPSQTVAAAAPGKTTP